MTGVQCSWTFSSDFYFASQAEVDPHCYIVFMPGCSITSLSFSYMVFIFNIVAYIFAMLGIWFFLFFWIHLPLHVTLKHTSHISICTLVINLLCYLLNVVKMIERFLMKTQIFSQFMTCLPCFISANSVVGQAH